MLRRAVPASAVVITSVVVAVMALTGCKGISVNAGPGQSQDPASGTTAGTGTMAGTQSGPLYVEPGAGFSAVYDVINHAKHSVDVTMYEFSDSTAGSTSTAR